MPPFGKRVGLKHLRPAFSSPPAVAAPTQNASSPVSNGGKPLDVVQEYTDENAVGSLKRGKQDASTPLSSSPDPYESETNGPEAKRQCLNDVQTPMDINIGQNENGYDLANDIGGFTGGGEEDDDGGIDNDQLIQVTDFYEEALPVKSKSSEIIAAGETPESIQERSGQAASEFFDSFVRFINTVGGKFIALRQQLDDMVRETNSRIEAGQEEIANCQQKVDKLTLGIQQLL